MNTATVEPMVTETATTDSNHSKWNLPKEWTDAQKRTARRHLRAGKTLEEVTLIIEHPEEVVATPRGPKPGSTRTKKITETIQLEDDEEGEDEDEQDGDNEDE